MHVALWRLVLIAAAGSAAARAAAECYVPEVEASALRFTAMQRGEAFAGRFRVFDGTLCLDPAHPESGHIELRVHTASVDSGLPEADDALRSALFLDAETHPHAIFTSTTVRALDDGRFEVAGRFALREGVQEIVVPFSFRPLPEGGAMLEGGTSIRRLDYSVGIGEWLDTTFLDDAVMLDFEVKLRAQ